MILFNKDKSLTCQDYAGKSDLMSIVLYVCIIALKKTCLTHIKITVHDDPL